MYVIHNDTSNLKGSGVDIMLKGLDNLLIEQSMKFNFKDSNNQAKYEALIADMALALEVGTSNLKFKSDSQLVATI